MLHIAALTAGHAGSAQNCCDAMNPHKAIVPPNPRRVYYKSPAIPGRFRVAGKKVVDPITKESSSEIGLAPNTRLLISLVFRTTAGRHISL
jgi:hypothetical protein